jgi:ABC-type sugar transport system permease subunit
MLNRPMWGGGLVRTLVFLPWCLSLFAAGLMFAYMARGQTGLGTSIAYALGIPRSVDFMTSALVIEVLALGAAWTMAPLVAFFLLANLKTIPKPLYDLAALDQLSRLETFRFVTLPPLGVRPQDMCVVAPERGRTAGQGFCDGASRPRVGPHCRIWRRIKDTRAGANKF